MRSLQYKLMNNFRHISRCSMHVSNRKAFIIYLVWRLFMHNKGWDGISSIYKKKYMWGSCFTTCEQVVKHKILEFVYGNFFPLSIQIHYYHGRTRKHFMNVCCHYHPPQFNWQRKKNWIISWNWHCIVKKLIKHAILSTHSDRLDTCAPHRTHVQ